MFPIHTYTISRDDSIYEAFPDVTLTADGSKMIAVFLECEHHLYRDNCRVMITESTDRGRTWSKKQPFTELTHPGGTYNCPRINTLPDGRLVVVCDRAVSRESEEHERDGVENFAWFSSDNGATWTEKVKLPAHGIVPDKYRVLSSGRHIVSCHYQSRETEKLEQYLWYSDDGGKTWSEKIPVAVDARYNLCEGNILELHDGTLVCFLRENSCAGIDCMKVFSKDGGEHWSGLTQMAIPACHRPVAGFLNDGRILLTHRFLQGAVGKLGSLAQNFFGAIFDEEQAAAPARQQSGCRIFPIDYDRNPAADLGYSGWVQFPDGEVYVVSYILDDAPKAQIRGYSFYPEEIILPVLETE